METTEASPVTPVPFRQPKPWIRWIAVALAAAGWYVSWQLLRVSGGASPDSALLQAVCGGSKAGGGSDDCTSVLTSPQAYVRIEHEGGGLAIPVSALGMGYFAFVGLWYLLVGPPAGRGRLWHLLIFAIVLLGGWQSVTYVAIMKYVLQRWCGGCLIAHGLNGGLLILTLLAWPWRQATRCGGPLAPHPSARLALATATGGLAVFATHLALVLMVIANIRLGEGTKRYNEVLGDPAFILWDFNRQAEVAIPLHDDEVFGGNLNAPNTVVVFGDFQCPRCRDTHELLKAVAAKYPDRLRVAYRYYPQDPECNPNPRYRGGGHASACRAARAAEAARLVGGQEAYLAMRAKLWEHQADFPKRPCAQQSADEQQRFENWAAELGLDRAAFASAMDSSPVADRIAADIALANQLGVEAIPVVYVNGRRLRYERDLRTWDAILSGEARPATQP